MSKITKTIAALGVVAGLGVAALPLASYAAPGTSNPQDITVTATLEDSLAMSVTETALTFMIENNGDVVKNSTTATVTTNNASGYNLDIQAKDGDTDLTATGDYTIPTGPAAQGTSAWGYNKDGGDTYQAVPAVATSIASSAAATEVGGEETTIYIGVSADSSQEKGVYTGGFTLTASNNA